MTSKLQTYGFAIVICCTAVVLAWLSGAPATCLLTAITVTSLFTGKGPSLLSVGLCVLALDFVFLSPVLHLPLEPSAYLRFAVFLLASLLIRFLIQSRQRALVSNNPSSTGFVQDASRQVQSKEEHQAREQHMDRMLEMLPGFVWTAEPDGEIEYLSHSILDYTGMTAEELKNNWHSAIHPDDIAIRERAFDQMARFELPAERELRVRRFDGVYRWFQSRTHAQLDDKGQVVHWYVITWDIEARKQAEDALRESEHGLRLIIETVPALIWLAGPDGNIVHGNQRMVDYFGVAREDFIEARWVNTMHPDDADAALRGWLKSVEAGTSYEATHRLRRADGEYRWFQLRGEPLRDKDGRVLHWYGVLLDIDDWKRADEALRQSEQHLRLTIETMPALVWRTTPDGEPDYVNQRVLDYLGKPLKDFVNSGWKTLVHPDDIEGTLRVWSHSVETGVSYKDTHRLRSADGSYRWFDVRGEALRDQDGRILHWYGVKIDIEDRKQMEEALMSTIERLSRATQISTVAELSAAIAHEINQPLAAVVANGYALRSWLSTTPPNLERALLIAERIIRDGNSGAEVVRRIRALFQQTAPTSVLLDINEVILEVLRLASDEIRQKGIYIETELEDPLPLTLADRVQMQQVIVNLVHNAIEAMEEVTDRPRLLSICSQRDSMNIVVNIRDHGVGFKNTEKIFEPFFTTKKQGMGMGLAICRTIVEAHGGRLTATSFETRGTTFTFSLPISPKEPGLANIL